MPKSGYLDRILLREGMEPWLFYNCLHLVQWMGGSILAGVSSILNERSLREEGKFDHFFLFSTTFFVTTYTRGWQSSTRHALMILILYHQKTFMITSSVRPTPSPFVAR